MFIGLEKIALFNEYFKFNIWIGIINAALIIHFFYNWYLSYKKTGFKIDCWHFYIFSMIILPSLLLYYVLASPYQATSLLSNENYLKVAKYTDLAWAISIAGYISMYLGKEILYREFFSNKRGFISNNIYDNIADEKINIINIILVAGILLGFIVFQIEFDCFFKLRDYFNIHTSIRPIYNILSSVAEIALIYIGINCIQYYSKNKFYIFIFLMFLSIFQGTRFFIINILSIILVFYSIKNKANIKVGSIVCIGIGIVVFLFVSVSLRDKGEIEYSTFKYMINSILYGSTFSDIRDFAWVLSNNDDKLLGGKSYLASLLSFIPSSISNYRQEYAFGAYTVKVCNIPFETHGGLRCGLFGEAYFNFGVVGVIIFGTIAGYFLSKSDCYAKYFIDKKNDIIIGFVSFVPMFLFFRLTPGLWFIYIFIIYNFGLYKLRKIIKGR